MILEWNVGFGKYLKPPSDEKKRNAAGRHKGIHCPGNLHESTGTSHLRSVTAMSWCPLELKDNTTHKRKMHSSSDPHPDNLFWHSFWHTTWKYMWHIYIYIESAILSGICSDILSDILPGIYSDNSFWHSIWHRFRYSFWHCIWHLFWHSIWHSNWHLFRHSIWHLFRHSFWHSNWQSIWHSVWLSLSLCLWHSLWHDFGSRRTPLYPARAKEWRQEWVSEGWSCTFVEKSRDPHLAGGRKKKTIRTHPSEHLDTSALAWLDFTWLLQALSASW